MYTLFRDCLVAAMMIFLLLTLSACEKNNKIMHNDGRIDLTPNVKSGILTQGFKKAKRRTENENYYSLC
jgi:hypothetical protein